MINRVLSGFGIIIFLMIASSAGVLYQTRNANSIVNDLVSVSNAKIEHAQTMRNAIQHRVMSINTMLILDDPFELDSEILRFHSYAASYIEARNKLRTLPMTPEEEQLHTRLLEQALASQPLTEQAVEMLSVGMDKKKVYTAIRAAGKVQAHMYASLDKLVALQKQYAQQELAKSKELYRKTFLAIVLIAVLVIGISLAIAAYVSHTVARKNKLLLDKNRELEVAYERAEAATKSKSAFLANMSHEIRTPITAIIGFAESSLLSSQTMEMRQKALNMIIRSSKHLLQVINDILDLSKFDANKLNIETALINVSELFDDVELIVRPLAEEKDLDFQIRTHDPLPEAIETDPFRLKQIILNFCSNAVKFTRQGQVVIDLKYDTQTANFVIEVTDSGIGLEKDQIDMIFEDFSQADATISRRFGGTGLGLSLSKNLAKALGIELEVESVPGEGSTFRLIMHAVARDLQGSKIPQPGEEMKMHALNEFKTSRLSGKILVVEDNLVNQQLLKLYLEKINVDMAFVENGKQAIEKAMAEKFDLILMDIQMPVMGGMEATRILRDRGYTKPIVALTANVMKEDVEKYIAAGCDECLFKPIENDSFFEVVGRYLEYGSVVEPGKGDPIKSEVIEEDSRLVNVAVNYLTRYLPDAISAIGIAIADMHWDELHNILTQVKGSSGSLGYIELREVVLKMEFQVLNKNQVELQLLFSELKRIHERMLAGMRLISENNIDQLSMRSQENFH